MVLLVISSYNDRGDQISEPLSYNDDISRTFSTTKREGRLISPSVRNLILPTYLDFLLALTFHLPATLPSLSSHALM